MDDLMHALRHSVAVTPMSHLALVRVGGADARAALDAVCAGQVRARDGQMQHAIMLRENARPYADAYLLCDDDEFDVIADGPTAEALVEHLRAHSHGLDVSIEDRSRSHVLLAADGPFAWELVSRIAGAQSVGLPYLTFFQADGYVVYRAGKTGEYGYGFLAPVDRHAALEQQIADHGATLDAATGTREALDQCALENLFFNIRREGALDVTPIELQLQWRVSYDKTAVGLDALRAHRAALLNGSRDRARRLTTLVCQQEVRPGDRVRLRDEEVGAIANAGWSVTRGDCVALALVNEQWAHPGIAVYSVESASGTTREARSVSGPVLNNRSLFVRTQLDSYARRDKVVAPPLARA